MKNPHVIGLLSDKNNPFNLNHITNFEFEEDEAVYSTGWVIMANPSDGNQEGNATLTIQKLDDYYELTLVGSFINRRKFDGDHFVATTAFFDQDGKRIFSLKAERGLNGTADGLRFKTKRGGATSKGK